MEGFQITMLLQYTGRGSWPVFHQFHANICTVCKKMQMIYLGCNTTMIEVTSVHFKRLVASDVTLPTQ